LSGVTVTTNKEGVVMINAALQSATEDLKPISKATVKVEVLFQNGKMIKSLAKLLYQEFERMAPYAEYKPISELTEQDLLSYLSTLLWLRVKAADEVADKALSLYKSYRHTVAVPVLWYQVLIGIGRAYDKDFGLEFVPAYKIPQELLLSPERLGEISNLFRQFEDSGMKIVPGIPKGSEGELDFMAMSHVNSEVLSYRKAHPVYGFLASFVAEQELNAITGTMSRVVYGYESDYEVRLSVLQRAINHATS
jgi:hypothetical protein